MAKEQLVDELTKRATAERAQRRELERMEREIRQKKRQDVDSLRLRSQQMDEIRFYKESESVARATATPRSSRSSADPSVAFFLNTSRSMVNSARG